MKRHERWALVVLLVAAGGSLLVGLNAICHQCAGGSRLIATAGLLATIAGVVQLDISGLFDKVIEEYSDANRWPHGPPSHITRQIIDNPDRPVATLFRNALFFHTRTGFWLIICGTVIQLVAMWL